MDYVKGRVKILIIALTLVIPQVVSARIGYSYEQCVTKYGTPSGSKKDEQGIHFVQWDSDSELYDFKIAYFVNGRVGRMALQLTNYKSYEDIIRAFLKANIPLVEWKEVDKRQKLFEHIGDAGVYGALASGRGRLNKRSQTTDKKTYISRYSLSYGSKTAVFIDTAAMLKLEIDREKNKKAAAERERENLKRKAIEGF